jgi:hypothetical protein
MAVNRLFLNDLYNFECHISGFNIYLETQYVYSEPTRTCALAIRIFPHTFRRIVQLLVMFFKINWKVTNVWFILTVSLIGRLRAHHMFAGRDAWSSLCGRDSPAQILISLTWARPCCRTREKQLATRVDTKTSKQHTYTVGSVLRNNSLSAFTPILTLTCISCWNLMSGALYIHACTQPRPDIQEEIHIDVTAVVSAISRREIVSVTHGALT